MRLIDDPIPSEECHEDNVRELYDYALRNTVYTRLVLPIARNLSASDHLGEDQKLAIWVDIAKDVGCVYDRDFGRVDYASFTELEIERAASDLAYYFENVYPGSRAEAYDLDNSPVTHIQFVE